MATLSRFLDMVRGVNRQRERTTPAVEADRARQSTRPFAPPSQTTGELANTRRHMEAELDVQREERAETAGHRGQIA